MVILQQFTTEPHPCAYLPDETAELEYTVVARMSAAEYEAHVDAGYRKFGAFLFRPICATCRACQSLRIPVEGFQPDRSQRRAWKRNSDLEIRYAPPVVDAQRLDLYQRYHDARSAEKGWPEHDRDPKEYAASFVHNPIPGMEITLWEDDSLRAVVLTELTPNGVSGVYHYHDPDGAERSLGTACMLHTIELARKLSKKWAYFGYYVAECGSLAYKARFRPCEVLGEDGAWRPYDQRTPLITLDPQRASTGVQADRG